MPLNLLAYMNKIDLSIRPILLKNHRKTTPYLWPKKVEAYSVSKTVARDFREEVAQDRTYHNKTKTKTEVTSKTD